MGCNTVAIKTANVLYQYGSLSKTIMVAFNEINMNSWKYDI